MFPFHSEDAKQANEINSSLLQNYVKRETYHSWPNSSSFQTKPTWECNIILNEIRYNIAPKKVSAKRQQLYDAVFVYDKN